MQQSHTQQRQQQSGASMREHGCGHITAWLVHAAQHAEYPRCCSSNTRHYINFPAADGCKQSRSKWGPTLLVAGS
jgi:hypothetical protein